MFARGSLKLVGLAVFGLTMVGCATSWVKKTPKDDDRYKYYVGRSYNNRSVNEGLNIARSDAKLRAIEENFGAHYKFQRDTHENINAAQVIDRLRAISKTVHLEEFEELEIHQEEVDDDRFNSAVLFRYPKQRISEEKYRLSTLKDAEEDFKFNSVDVNPEKRSYTSQVDHRIVQSTYVFGIGASANSSSMNETDNSVPSLAAFAEMRLNRYVVLNAHGSFGQKINTYSDGTLVLSENTFGIDMPIYFWSADKSAWNAFLVPGIEAIRSNFSFLLSPTSTNPIAEVTKWQIGYAGSIGLQFRLLAGDTSGLSLRSQVGLFHSIKNSEAISGKTAVQGGLFISWELFR